MKLDVRDPCVHCACPWLISTNVLMVLIDPGLNALPSLSNEDLPTLAEDGVYARCSQAKVMLDGPKETGDFLRWETYSFDIMFGE